MSFHLRDIAKLTRREPENRSRRLRNLSMHREDTETQKPTSRYVTYEPLKDKPDPADDLRGNSRHHVQIRAEIRESGGGRYDVWVSDMSQSGFRMQLICRIESERGILLMLPGMKPLRARIAWREGNYYGCMFEKPLHIAVFDHIARQFGD